MKSDVKILVAEPEKTQFRLLQQNMRYAGLRNSILWFADAKQLLDFLDHQEKKHTTETAAYLLILELELPDVMGTGVLEIIKADRHLKSIPVIVYTKLDEPEVIEACYSLGCSTYLVKSSDKTKPEPEDRSIALFLAAVEVPMLSHALKNSA